ncbi:hypothetical protein BKA58DRAFT_305346 [Alternaria rosae]|uniref:uncharacterized protein n=1 Tax=Alternaria rosae TaxID=1187941 RepID=UPI001E8EEF75|nr:uncharacterized protein BKA58DRAFT_305346 [Alternaria rosae]KAH6881333.1 hypothetical protein BKA58DRAFT_305346 [Alternaria rosae]
MTDKRPRAPDGIINPTLIENWPPEPVTEAHFEEWLTKTREALLAWLTQSALVDQDATTKENINKHYKKAKQTWEDLIAPMAFDERGDAINKEDKDLIVKKRTPAKAASTRVHKPAQTWRKFIEHRYAQASWEDYLYYQNVWNRRHLEANKYYVETAAEKLAVAARKEPRKAATTDNDDSEDKVLPFKADGLNEGNPRNGTPGQLEIKAMSDDREGAFYHPYMAWRNHMIRLYKTFKLAYRKRAPAIIEPDVAHRYSQPPRGTMPQHLSRFRRRHKHLEERFPRRRRQMVDVREVEEDYCPDIKRQKDNELERKGEMVSITWRINEDAYQRKKTATDTNSGFSNNPLTLELLPQVHITHHGSTETSFNWPTSFDSPAWGTTRSVTLIRRDYHYERVPDNNPEDDDNNNDDNNNDDNNDANQPKSKSTPYKTDKSGNRIKKLDATPRYEKEERTEQENIFIYDRLPNGEVAGRDRHGKWKGQYKMINVHNEHPALDEAGNRILLPRRYMTRNKFKIQLEARGSVRMTRSQRHVDRGITDQLSEDEDEGRVDSNKNFSRSGNVNPDLLGNPWADNIDSDGEGEGGEGVDHPGDSDDDESGDEGDLFAESYREGSESPATKRARLLLEDIREKFGILESFSIEEVMELQRDDGEFLACTDEEIMDWYKRGVEML